MTEAKEKQVVRNGHDEVMEKIHAITRVSEMKNAAQKWAFQNREKFSTLIKKDSQTLVTYEEMQKLVKKHILPVFDHPRVVKAVSEYLCHYFNKH